MFLLFASVLELVACMSDGGDTNMRKNRDRYPYNTDEDKNLIHSYFILHLLFVKLMIISLGTVDRGQDVSFLNVPNLIVHSKYIFKLYLMCQHT